jgi:PDZ domain
MKYYLRITLLLLVASITGLAQNGQRLPATDWEKSIVRVEVSRKLYDYYQPWNQRTDRSMKTGLVVGEREILTTCQDMSDRTLVRVQKDGRGKWTNASVTWVDYYANLALLTVEDASFWSDLAPANLAGSIPAEGATFQILRWREGKLENRQAEFTQFAVRQSEFSAISHVQMELDSEIQMAGSGEPVVLGSNVVGLVSRQQGRACKAIPAPFIRAILEARRAGTYRGLGYFHFYWQPAENTTTLSSLGLTSEPRGVLVINVPERPDGLTNVLKPRDIILQIDGFDVDIQGDYNDPAFGPLMLENLATRGKWAGDDIKLKIWRDGKPLDLTYRLPKYEYSHSVVPFGVHDQPPEYLILGGLVFQPLTYPYLQRWGSEWERRAPFRLTYYTPDEATKEQPSVVVLSQVLPDPYNIGYQDQRYQVVEKVNGRRVHNLAELRDALKSPEGQFQVIEFQPNDSAQRIVLAADGPEQEATQRVLERYGIAEPAFISTDAKDK